MPFFQNLQSAFAPSETAGVPDAYWPRLFQIMRRFPSSFATPQPQQAELSSNLEFEGVPMYSANKDLAQVRGLRPNTPVGGPVQGPQQPPPTPPSVFPVPQTMSTGEQTVAPDMFTRIRQLGQQLTPQPVTNAMYPAGSDYARQHPTLSRWVDSIMKNTAAVAPESGAARRYAGAQALAQQQAALPATQFAQGAGALGSISGLEQAEAKAQRDAEMFPYDLRYKKAQTEAAEALAEYRRRVQEDGADINTFRKEFIELKSIPEAQRTPEQRARLEALMMIPGVGSGSSANYQRDTVTIQKPGEEPREVQAIFDPAGGRYIDPATKEDISPYLTEPAPSPGQPTAYKDWRESLGHEPSGEEVMDFVAAQAGTRAAATGGVRAVQKAQEDFIATDRNLYEMREARDRVESGRSTAPGADDEFLFSRHVAMTFGEVPGARTTRELIEHHRNAISLDSRLERAYQKILSGQQLTKEQRAEFVHLGELKVAAMKRSLEATKQTFSGGGGMSTGETPMPSIRINPDGTVDILPGGTQ